MKATKRKASKSKFGFDEQLPEGVFGILDDITPVMRPERLHSVAWGREGVTVTQAKGTKKAKKTKRKKPRPAIKVPPLTINEDHYADHLPDLEYDNAVEVSEDILNKVRRKTDLRTAEISRVLMSRFLPTLLGLDAAQSFVTSAMRDGLGIEVSMDDSILEGAKGLINIDLMYYMLRRSSLPKRFKKQYLTTLIDEQAKASVVGMVDRSKSSENKTRLKDMQSVIVRGLSEAARNEDKKRRGITPNIDEPFSQAILGDQGSAPSHVGALRRRNLGSSMR